MTMSPSPPLMGSTTARCSGSQLTYILNSLRANFGRFSKPTPMLIRLKRLPRRAWDGLRHGLADGEVEPARIWVGRRAC